MKVIYFFSFLVLVLGACKKNEPGATNVEINFTEPAAGDTIASYNQIHAEGTITGDGTMQGYTVTLSNTQSGAVLFSNAYDVQSESYNFHEHWTNNLSDTSEVTVRVEVTKDKNGNKTAKEIKVVCLP